MTKAVKTVKHKSQKKSTPTVMIKPIKPRDVKMLIQSLTSKEECCDNIFAAAYHCNNKNIQRSLINELDLPPLL